MGSNGKSMLQRLIKECFGDYCVSVGANVLTSKRVDPGKPNPEMYVTSDDLVFLMMVFFRDQR